MGRDLSYDIDLSSTTDSHENHHGNLSSAHHDRSDPHNTALHSQNKKPAPSSLSSEIVRESILKLPKWKRVLNRLIRGGLLRKGKEKVKKKKKKTQK